MAAAALADYCCELLATLGPCLPRRMFGGHGISTDGLNVAIVVDLGQGELLWLKANADTRPRFEAAGCQRFTYLAKGQPRSLDYYSAPEDAMESPAAMAPWARLAMQAALAARAPKPRKPPAGKRAAPPAPARRAARKAGTPKTRS